MTDGFNDGTSLQATFFDINENGIMDIFFNVRTTDGNF